MRVLITIIVASAKERVVLNDTQKMYLHKVWESFLGIQSLLVV